MDFRSKRFAIAVALTVMDLVAAACLVAVGYHSGSNKEVIICVLWLA